ncbi:myeloid-associated differentiation marker homolog [Mugil cephalus]|uniref:myeloid-associated differentiation marker homolog n=1 Tax=Mugil cephalus TaxID=48193 RepID=UPI001FB75AAF|nr:myeloid-associated differentiation marker homolog [Mugil cephalus]
MIYRVDVRSLIQPVGILRIIEAFLSCLCFSLVASVGHKSSPHCQQDEPGCVDNFWAWCMFTWCFCCFFTLLIIILEFTTLSSKVPFAWDDFTTAFAMLAGLMCLSAGIIYPSFFTCSTCHKEIIASAMSSACFGVYTAEASMTLFRPRGQTIGFLSTLPGIMKMLETFMACIIFMSLETMHYNDYPGLKWCVSVYSLCFIFSLVIILLSLLPLNSFIPFSIDKIVVVYNILAALAYFTAMVIWPVYNFSSSRTYTKVRRDKAIIVTVMSIFNFIVYTLDSLCAVRLVFITGRAE